MEEKYEEARHGCPHNCQRLAKSKDDTVCDTEANFIVAQIEQMADSFHAGERIKPQSYDVWQWELFVYWIKTEKSFEREIWVKLGFVADRFLKQK